MTALEDARPPDPAGERETEAALCQGRGPGLERDADPYSEAEGGRVVAVFQGNTYLSELTLLRQQSAEVIRRIADGHPDSQGGHPDARR